MPAATCPDCKGTGKIALFTSVVECECQKPRLQTYDPEKVEVYIGGVPYRRHNPIATVEVDVDPDDFTAWIDDTNDVHPACSMSHGSAVFQEVLDSMEAAIARGLNPFDAAGEAVKLYPLDQPLCRCEIIRVDLTESE